MKRIEEYHEGVDVRISTFALDKGCGEIYAMFEPKPQGSFTQQVEQLSKAVVAFSASHAGYVLLSAKMLVSDAGNQEETLLNTFASIIKNACITIIQQPPMAGQKAVLIVYLAQGLEFNGETKMFSHNGYSHLWTSSKGNHSDSYMQSVELLNSLEETLNAKKMSIEANCVRTWFYVRDIDANYTGMVNGRKSVFSMLGLRPDTHYIASTGIEGRTSGAHSLVKLDSYCISGFEKEQIKYLYAKTHLNPTYEYGVTFERGTSVNYGDRSHIFLSGTASINNKGEILHVGDIKRQTERMWENCEALLAEANATLDDFAYIVVYIRDMADYACVKAMYEARFPDTPVAIVNAPVCRPGWLIEMEGVAIVENKNEHFRTF